MRGRWQYSSRAGLVFARLLVQPVSEWKIYPENRDFRIKGFKMFVRPSCSRV
jgi:hypothetical protein